MPSFSEFLFGSPDKLKKVPTGTPQQQQLHNSLIAKLMNMTPDTEGYDQAQDYFKSLFQPGNQAFENFSSPYIQQFQEQILPQIAERFAGAGALSSSGFGQSIGGAASGLQSQLAQLFASLQNQAAGALTNQYNQENQQYNQTAQLGLGYQPFAYQQKQGSGGFLGPLATGLGTALGGPLGGALGSGIQSLFKPKTSGYGNNAGNAALSGAMFF